MSQPNQQPAPANPSIIPAPNQPASSPSTANPAPQGGGRGRGRGRGGRGGRGRGGPPPATAEPHVVPSPGTTKAPPSANSTAPTFTSWGTPNVTMERRNVRREFTPSASSYQDLIEAEYDILVSRHGREGVKIPRAMFTYFANLAWWYRALFLKKENSRLTTNERECLRLLEVIDGAWYITDRLAQYLKGMGNFTTNGERFEITFRQDFDFTANLGLASPSNLGGFYNTPNGRRTNATTQWHYYHYPVPGISFLSMQRELDHIRGNNLTSNLANIQPTVNVFPGATNIETTNNICGYETNVRDSLHGSWDDTYNHLGIRESTQNNRIEITPGFYSHWLINQSILRWVSERLTSLSDYKTFLVKDVNRSKEGIYFQMAYHDIPEYEYPRYTGAHMRQRFRAIRDVATTLQSSIPVTSAHIGPALACGYRQWIRFTSLQNVAGVTLQSPWIPIAAGNVIVTFPVASRVAANADYSQLPAEYSQRIYSTGSVERGPLLHYILS